MSTAAATLRRRPTAPAGDRWLLLAAGLLLGLGLLMVASASVSVAERQTGWAFHYFQRQALYVLLALALGALALRVPLARWQALGPYCLLAGLALLVLVLVLGREVNGSVRWLHLGPVNLQPSELMKPALVLYLAGYLVRRREEVPTLRGFLRPMLVLSLVGALLLMEPDFGAAAVIAGTALGLLFLGGVRAWQFLVLLGFFAGLLALLVWVSPYRLRRVTAFLDPWADPYNTGFQLTQALIAFGRGEWLGVGLGASVQKLFYLPEAHTDFLPAVLAEELGLAGTLLVLGLFALLVLRAYVIGRHALAAGRPFAAYLAWGLGLGLGLQAFVNLGVNMGLLPTKGLTLPLMSYGGSSVVASVLMVALILRVSRECPPPATARRAGRGP